MPRRKTSTPQKPLLRQSRDDKGKEISMEEEEDEEETSSKLLLSQLQLELELELEGSSSSSPDGNSPSCFSLLNYTCTPKLQGSTEKLSEVYELWRESQRAAAVNISRQLKSKWDFDFLIDAQLAKFKAHYTGDNTSSVMLPSHVPGRLFPSWNPSLFTASLAWLGDTWRPSSILSLIAPALGLTSPLSANSQRVLTESIRRFRIEEAVLDEEMAEYQSMSVLNLRVAGTKRKGRRGGGTTKLGIVYEEMRKVESVVDRAQRLRYKAMEVALKGGALSKTQAGEFLLALAGVEEAVRRQAVRWRTRSGALAIEVQAFD